jgi:hypothetical protein
MNETLTHLGEPDTGDGRDANRRRADQERSRRKRRLDHDDGEGDATDDVPHAQDGGHIDQHAERDEEQTGQDVADRSHFRERLMAELALGEHEAGEKRTNRHRQSEERAQRCRSNGRDDDRERKRFTPAARRHQPQELREQEAAPARNRSDGESRLAERQRHR